MSEIDEAIRKFDQRELDEFRYWTENLDRTAAKLLDLADFLDEFGIGIGDHSDRPLLLAAATMLPSGKDGSAKRLSPAGGSG